MHVKLWCLVEFDWLVSGNDFVTGGQTGRLNKKIDIEY